MKRRRRRLLLLLYPRSWRRQYGEEFLQFLEDLDADLPRGGVRRACNAMLGAMPVQLIHRRPATTVLLFFVAGVLATLDVYGPVDATSREAIAWGWVKGSDTIIVAGRQHTWVGKGYSVQEGTSNPIVRIQVTNRHGKQVTLDCRDRNCTPVDVR
jgi:hypothetical protein